MDIEIIKVGDLECNCYILSKDNSTLVIDPGADFDKINDKLVNNNLLAILLTHHHFDHVGAVNDIVNMYNVEVYDSNNLEEDEYTIGPFTFNVIYTKGHSSDSITFYFKEDNVMFVGDFVFKNNIGRCDLPTGNINEMMKSINKIKKYDDNIVLYSGHGNSTILGIEKKNNMYFKEENLW